MKPILVVGGPFSRHFSNHNLEVATVLAKPDLIQIFSNFSLFSVPKQRPAILLSNIHIPLLGSLKAKKTRSQDCWSKQPTFFKKEIKRRKGKQKKSGKWEPFELILASPHMFASPSFCRTWPSSPHPHPPQCCSPVPRNSSLGTKTGSKWNSLSGLRIECN